MPTKMQMKAPSLPGVYFFKNKSGKILYVGKAANLKARLGSYFQKNQKPLKTELLLKETTNLSWQILSSETEALIKESELIKKYQPKYNVLMRDDKQYFFVAFTKETYPKIYLTHQTSKGPEYIGPFTDGNSLKSVLKLLRRIFPYCTCKMVHKNLCLNARIGRCPGFCCAKTEITNKSRIQNYKKNINSIKSVLVGKNKSLAKTLKNEMKKLSAEQKYKEAGKIRDQIRALEKIFAHKGVLHRDIISENIKAVSALESILKIKNVKRIEAYDIANIQGKHAYGSMAVFVDGAPAKDLYRIFKIKTVSGSNDVAMLKEVITRRFQHKEWQYPDVILVDGGKGQLSATVDALNNSPPQLFESEDSSESERPPSSYSKRRGARGVALLPKIIALTKNEKHSGDRLLITGRKGPLALFSLPQSLSHLLLHLDTEAHRFAIRHYRKSHGKTIL